MAIAGILFDWRGTLVVPPTLEEWVSDGLHRVGRAHEERDVQELAARITASNGIDDRMDAPGIDADAALHRRIFMDVLSDAGIDAPLSFEVGSQKPEAPIFRHALDRLGLEAADVAMVGDRSRPDGGAVELGMVTLLLPPLRSPEDERLHAVIKLAL